MNDRVLRLECSIARLDRELGALLPSHVPFRLTDAAQRALEQSDRAGLDLADMLVRFAMFPRVLTEWGER